MSQLAMNGGFEPKVTDAVSRSNGCYAPSFPSLKLLRAFPKPALPAMLFEMVAAPVSSRNFMNTRPPWRNALRHLPVSSPPRAMAGLGIDVVGESVQHTWQPVHRFRG